MKNKNKIYKKFLFPLIFTVVFLLGFFVFISKAQAGCCYCGDINTNPNFCIKGVIDESCPDCKEPDRSKFVKYDAQCSLCPEEGCCVKTRKIDSKVDQCVVGLTRAECEEIKPLSTTTGEYVPKSCYALKNDQCKDVPIVVAGKTKKEPPKAIFFKPNITIPGSKFIAGKAVQITGASLGEWISAFYLFFCGVVGILAAVNIIYGGFKWLTSFGNPTRIASAKERISSAIIGIVLTLGAYIILLTISPQLVQFKSLTIKTIETIEQLEAAERSEKGATAVVWDGQNVSTYNYLLAEVAKKYSLDRNWLKALMLVESGGKSDAISSAGACGLMQLLPTTAGLSCDQLKNPETNMEAAAKYYQSLVKNTCPEVATTKSGKEIKCDLSTNCKDGEIKYVNAAYNGGRGANCSSHDAQCTNQTWWECQNNDGFAETRAYVQKVQQAYEIIRNKGW